MEGCVWKNNKLDDTLPALSPKAPLRFGDDGAFFGGLRTNAISII